MSWCRWALGLAAGGGLLLMLQTDWRLAMLAVLLRAPLIGHLAAVAGRFVGRYSAMQQAAMNDANAWAAESLAEARLVHAHGARARPSGMTTRSREIAACRRSALAESSWGQPHARVSHLSPRTRTPARPRAGAHAPAAACRSG